MPTAAYNRLIREPVPIIRRRDVCGCPLPRAHGRFGAHMPPPFVHVSTHHYTTSPVHTRRLTHTLPASTSTGPALSFALERRRERLSVFFLMRKNQNKNNILFYFCYLNYFFLIWLNVWKLNGQIEFRLTPPNYYNKYIDKIIFHYNRYNIHTDEILLLNNIL